jgi:hypothetical protein
VPTPEEYFLISACFAGFVRSTVSFLYKYLGTLKVVIKLSECEEFLVLLLLCRRWSKKGATEGIVAPVRSRALPVNSHVTRCGILSILVLIKQKN